MTLLKPIWELRFQVKPPPRNLERQRNLRLTVEFLPGTEVSGTRPRIFPKKGLFPNNKIRVLLQLEEKHCDNSSPLWCSCITQGWWRRGAMFLEKTLVKVTNQYGLTKILTFYHKFTGDLIPCQQGSCLYSGLQLKSTIGADPDQKQCNRWRMLLIGSSVDWLWLRKETVNLRICQ